MTKGVFQVLGSGGSLGIPVVGCHCEVCRSTLPQNKRMRPSALITYEGKIILIDAGPDFRLQALTQGIDHIDGVIFTHAHHDHSAGLDELRIFTLRSGQPLPCLLSNATLHELKMRFYYIFAEESASQGLKLTTNLALQCLDQPVGETVFEGLKIQYLSYHQGGMQVNGFRFGDLAFLTDIKDYSSDIFASLVGVKTLVISALRFMPSPLHFTVDDAVEFALKVGAEQTWLTHIAHELEHERTNAYLPESIRLSYDGLELPFSMDS